MGLGRGVTLGGGQARLSEVWVRAGVQVRVSVPITVLMSTWWFGLEVALNVAEWLQRW